MKSLLAIKAEYKKETGTDYKPKPQQSKAKVTETPQNMAESSESQALHEKITAQGDKVRTLKTSKAAKGEIDAAVKVS